MNDQTVSKMLMMLSVVFQEKKTSDAFYAIYRQMLSDIPAPAVVAAIKLCLCKCRFFPTIAEIRENTKPYFAQQKKLEQAETERRIDEKYGYLWKDRKTADQTKVCS